MIYNFDEVREIVLKAGEIFKEGFFATKKEVDFKGKKELVTEYDVKIEDFLTTELSKFDGFNIVAEEKHFDEEIKNSFIIDPIDGTTNFLHQIPFCAISVGIYQNGFERGGIVYNPITNEMYWAKKGEGAYLNDKKISVSDVDVFQRALIGTGFPYSAADNEEDLRWVVSKLQKLLPKVQDIRRFGSAALDLCYVANGKLDGFYEINLKPWDVAAGKIIVREAGGIVTNNYGEDYEFWDKCIVATNGRFHQEFVEALMG